jgi:hypothetical protein
MTQPTRPQGIPEDTPRILRLDPAGPQQPIGEALRNPKLWYSTNKWNATQKDRDERAGGGPVSEARLEVEEDIETVVRDAFEMARNRLFQRVEGGEGNGQ